MPSSESPDLARLAINYLGGCMNRKFLTAVAAAALLVGTAANASPLDGQTVMVNLTAGGIDFGTQSVIVGAGDEGNYFGNTFFDLNGGVNGDEFVYTSSGGYCGIVCSGDAVWTLSNLNFGTPLTGFSILQQDVGAITIDSLTATSVSFHYADGYIHPGVNVIGKFETGSVPEPASWAMMLGGFGAIGGAMRARRKAAVSFA